MTKLKPMLPTLRERKRYVAYELKSKSRIAKDVSQEIVDDINDTLGMFDSAKAGVLSVEYDKAGQRGILRVAHDKVNEVRTALALKREADKKQVLPRVLGMSGSLKKARKKYMN